VAQLFSLGGIKRMAPFLLMAYIVVVGLLIRFTTGWERDKMHVIIGILIAAFVGWFVLIGMISEGASHKSGISISQRGAKTGFRLLGMWFTYILFLLAAAAVLFIVMWIFRVK
jgi:hypothetical protein